MIHQYLKHILWFLIVFIFIYFSFITSNTDNPVRLPSPSAEKINLLFPQGWAFFTRNPKEDLIRIYSVESNELKYLNKTSSLNLKDFFGINRRKRRLSLEFAEIMKRIPIKSWNEYNNDNLVQSIRALETTDTINNVFGNNILHGEIVIYQSKRIPWAWSNSNVRMPYKLVKIYVK